MSRTRWKVLTILFTALARSLGIPTRVIVGMAYSDAHFDGKPRFYYHAWPEVFVGKWVPMDPTLGQEIADARHVRLIEGALESWVQLLGVIGQIRIEVQECA